MALINDCWLVWVDFFSIFSLFLSPPAAFLPDFQNIFALFQWPLEAEPNLLFTASLSLSDFVRLELREYLTYLQCISPSPPPSDNTAIPFFYSLTHVCLSLAQIVLEI
jgi:hypothetical protein